MPAPNHREWILFARAGRAVAFAAALWLLAVSFRSVDLASALQLVVGLGASVVLIPLPFLAGIAIDSVNLRRLLVNLGQRVSLGRVLAVRLATEAVVISAAGGAVLADGLAPYLFHQRDRVPVPVSVAAGTIRKCLLVASQAIYFGIAFALGHRFLRDRSVDMVGVPGLEWVVPGIAAGLAAMSAVLAAALLRGRLAERAHSALVLVPSDRWARWLERIGPGFTEADAHLRSTTAAHVAGPALLYVVHWLTEAVETYLILRLLGVDLGFGDVLAFETMLSLLRHVVFFVPSGIGFQDVGYMAALAAAGVPEASTVGAAFVVLKRTKEALWSAVGYSVLIAMGGAPRRVVKALAPAPAVAAISGGRNGPRKKLLFMCGSMNQTTQMHRIAAELPEYEQWFTPFYTTGFDELVRRSGAIESTIAGSKHVRRCREYLKKHGLSEDYRGSRDDYDLVVVCQDQLTQRNILDKRVVLVQEGMLDPTSFLFSIYKRLRFIPRWIVGTCATGQSGNYAKFCVASEAWRRYFLAHGLRPEKLVVTGIPNFDDCEAYRNNTFPYAGYVLVCTSDMRETGKRDDRKKFLSRVNEIAAGRKIIIKLHPNEKHARARREIEQWSPSAIVLTEGSAEEMVANCDVLVCQYSTLALVGLSLGKEVHSYFDLADLKTKIPDQNRRAAKNIAAVCRDVLGDGSVQTMPTPPGPVAFPSGLARASATKDAT